MTGELSDLMLAGNVARGTVRFNGTGAGIEGIAHENLIGPISCVGPVVVPPLCP